MAAPDSCQELMMPSDKTLIPPGYSLNEQGYAFQDKLAPVFRKKTEEEYK